MSILVKMLVKDRVEGCPSAQCSGPGAKRSNVLAVLLSEHILLNIHVLDYSKFTEFVGVLMAILLLVTILISQHPPS